MVLSAQRTRAAIVAASLAFAATLATATFAQATSTEDPRAVAVYDNAKTCEQAGLDGERLAEVDGEDGDETSLIEFTGGKLNTDQYLTITSVDPTATVTGIVVKGGDGYNVYEPGQRGLEADPAWEELRAPLNKGGNIPQISHWFVCGTVDDSTTPPSSTEPPTTTTEPPSATTEPPSSSEPPASSEPPVSTTTDDSTPPEATDTTEPGEGPSSTTTTPGAAADVEDSDDDLALTGFGAGWMVPIGALLIIGGGAALWLARSRKRMTT